MATQDDVEDLMRALQDAGNVNDLRRALDGQGSVADLTRALDAARCHVHFGAYLRKLEALAVGVSEMKRLGVANSSDALKNAVYNTQLDLGKLRAEVIACPDCAERFAEFLRQHGVQP